MRTRSIASRACPPVGALGEPWIPFDSRRRRLQRGCVARARRNRSKPFKKRSFHFGAVTDAGSFTIRRKPATLRSSCASNDKRQSRGRRHVRSVRAVAKKFCRAWTDEARNLKFDRAKAVVTILWSFRPSFEPRGGRYARNVATDRSVICSACVSVFGECATGALHTCEQVEHPKRKTHSTPSGTFRLEIDGRGHVDERGHRSVAPEIKRCSACAARVRSKATVISHSTNRSRRCIRSIDLRPPTRNALSRMS